MATYKAPLRDMRFVLYELHRGDALAHLPGFEEMTPDLIDPIPDSRRSGQALRGGSVPTQSSRRRARVRLRKWRGAYAQGIPGGVSDLPRRRLDVDRLRSGIWRPGATAFCGHVDRRDDLFIQPVLWAVSRSVIRRV